MKQSIFKGSAVALVTPFKPNGEVNYFRLKRLIEFHIASGTKAIVILGTTGESATITQEERTKIIRFCVWEISNRIPLIVGTGSNSTSKTIELTKEAENLGANACLIVSPYYNKTSQNGLFLHYKTVANKTKLPIIIYNVPSRTGINILPETVLKLSKIKNIVAIKDAGGNISQSIKLLRTLPDDFYVYSGDDSLTFSLMCLGAKGVISVTANCYPTLVSSLADSIMNRNYDNALRLDKFLYKINTNLFLDVNPICIKFYMNINGINVGEPRLPLTKPAKEVQLLLNQTKTFYEN